jgi:hypothetical protein
MCFNTTAEYQKWGDVLRQATKTDQELIKLQPKPKETPVEPLAVSVRKKEQRIINGRYVKTSQMP